jgi:hypothetical protein
MAMIFRIGPDVITSYKRLAYTPWHALAEFVDNSTQAYFNDRENLDALFKAERDRLTVSIAYERDDDLLRIADNSSGMDYHELETALHVGHRPANADGRSRYGMGMKTAACWLGDKWTVRTKRFGNRKEYEVTVDVVKVADGEVNLPIREKKIADTHLHYTVIEIKALHRPLKGRTLGKVRDYLRSMYREDFRNKILRLIWQGEELAWDELDSELLRATDGSVYKKKFEFKVNGKSVNGWVGILARGSRAKAGFSILHSGRVVRGWPDSWRPESLYGQLQGSNDLVNQRLVGEIHLDAFDVSHTKDDILWVGDDEELVEKQLLKCCADYRDVAKSHRSTPDERGPSTIETETAVEELQRELRSPEMVDVITLEVTPPPEAIHREFQKVIDSEGAREPRFSAKIAGITVKGYLMDDGSENDPYFVCDSTRRDEVALVVNLKHPHWTQLKGAEGVLNYLRHCTYDALAEHQARFKVSRIDPDTVKLWKDKFLRLPLVMEMHGGTEEAGAEESN